MKEFLLDLLFPKSCLGCRKEGTYLCQDCFALIEISDRVFTESKEITAVFFAADYENLLVKKLIRNFKYQPFAKDLAKILASVIIIYFQNLEKQPSFLEDKNDFILVPIPTHKKRLRWRGFNQAEEIAKILSARWKIPLVNDALIKTRKTLPQLNLPQEIRKKNVQGVFLCPTPELVKEKKIILVDDVFTTGATMEEAARALKKGNPKEIYGIVVAKANP